MVVRRPYYYLVTLLLILTLPLNAQKGKINYSDKNMRWIINRLNTELTFTEFSKRFKGAAIGSQDDLKSYITATKGVEGEIYFYSDKYITYRVFVDKNDKAIYAKAGRRLGSKEDKTAQKGLYNIPVYTYDGDNYVSTYQFRDSNDPMVHFVDDDRGRDYLLWGDRANQLLVRLTMFSNEFDGIEVMVNGWYENSGIEQWRRKDIGVKQPMDFNQLLNIEELNFPKILMALRKRIETSWTKAKEEDIFTLDLSQKDGICIEGCDDPNGDQKVFYGNLYYEGPMKNGLPHGQSHYLAQWKNTLSKLDYIINEMPIDYERFSSQRTTGLNFIEGKAQGTAEFSQKPKLTITYESGMASYVEGYFPEDMKLSVLDKAYKVESIQGPIKNGKWTNETAFFSYETGGAKVFYKGEINDAYEANGKGTFYHYYIPNSEKSKPDYKQKSRLSATVEATWVKGQMVKEQYRSLKTVDWTYSGVDIRLNYKTGRGGGEQLSVISNRKPEYRSTGKMTGRPCPTGTWKLEEFNANTNEYEPTSITEEYVIENGYCMYKGTYDEDGNQVAMINLLKREEYISPEERAALIAQEKERERLEEIYHKKRAEEAKQREYAQLAAFEDILRQYTDSDVKIASKGWLTNFPKGKTTGSAGIFIINTNKSSKTFTGTVTFTHPTKGEDTQDITLRVNGANSNGYGAAKAPYNLGFGRSYEIAFDLDGNTSGVYYFIYYFGILR